MSWQTVLMTDKNIKDKQSLIQQLRDVAEKETAWLEKNRLLYTQKREQLDHLIKERGLIGGEVTPQEQKLSKHVALYESRRAGMWDLATGINREEKNLQAMKARRKKKKGQISEQQMVKHLENMGFAVTKEASQPKSKIIQTATNPLIRPVLEFFYTEFLRDCCRDCGVKVGGTKADLIDRLCTIDLDTEYFLRHLSIDQLEEIADGIEHQSGIQITWESEDEAVYTLTEIIDGDARFTNSSSKNQSKQKPQSPEDTVVDLWRDKSEVDVASARSKQASAKRRLAGQLNTFNRCPYCTDKLTFERSHVDHIHPVSKGGVSEDYNLVLVCAPCNTSKGSKTLRAFCRDAELNFEVVVARLEQIGKEV